MTRGVSEDRRPPFTKRSKNSLRRASRPTQPPWEEEARNLFECLRWSSLNPQIGPHSEPRTKESSRFAATRARNTRGLRRQVQLTRRELEETAEGVTSFPNTGSWITPQTGHPDLQEANRRTGATIEAPANCVAF